jgi:peroxiredoxin
MYRMREVFRSMTMPWARRVRGPYGPLGAMPTNFVIDRAGRLRYAQAGAFNLQQLNALLIPLLNERPPT